MHDSPINCCYACREQEGVKFVRIGGWNRPLCSECLDDYADQEHDGRRDARHA